VHDALTLRYLDGGHGEGCHNDDDAWTHRAWAVELAGPGLRPWRLMVLPPPDGGARALVMVTGATSTQLLPMCTSAPITVRCLLAPS
jgi:hypothetical protein